VNFTTSLQAFLLLLLALPAAGQSHQRGATRNPHGPRTLRCESCHTVTGWRPIRSFPEFDHNKTRDPLRGMHTKVDCRSCHVKLMFSDVGAKCADCHADLHRGQFGARCEQCHTVSGWNVSVAAIKEHRNRFPLLGAHAAVECSACHTGAAVGQFQGLRTDCVSCHLPEYQNTKSMGLDHPGLGFPTNCESCHTADTWLGATFDHSRTGFALVGAHARLDCTACHVGGKFQGLPVDCYSCHAKDYQGTSNPSHVSAAIPKDCLQCHTMSSWQGAQFDHTQFTKFPLTGAHVKVACASCHINGQFVGTPTTCVSCHLKDYNGTTNPNHISAGIPQTCELCHTTSGWNPASFDHNKTPFPLTGAHVTVACTSCHIGGKYAGTPTTCVSCHLKDYNGTTNPSHVSAGIPQTCDVCHSTAAWSPATFDHSKTGFPLTGAHVNVACTSCHIGGKYAGTPTDCYSCHTKDWQGTSNPSHAAAGFPTTCQTCHTTSSWAGATFDHWATKFPLTGAHLTVACSTCHVNNQFATLSTTCVSCHLKEFNGTTNPNHVSGGFPQTCETCHTTTAWSPSTFDHSKTAFPLTGAHVTVACTLCHVGGKFAGTPTDCYSCHTKDWQGTTNPNHAAAGFPTDCSVCHSTTNWLGATFDHSKTSFPLTGAHLTVACGTCHVNNQFATLSTTCVSCHLKDFQGATSPNHVASGFPQTCETCHTTTAWSPSTFDHNKTAFPLTGAHVTVLCSLCHVGGKFAGTPTDCYSCHKTEYQGTTNPNHAAAGFPTTCQTCHTTTSWLGATFNHTWFPIPHRTATLCSDCHTNSADYKVFVCTNCHTQSQTDPKHQGVRGYVWNSTNCYACHPTGRAG
jgi:hypothetical protein